MPRGTSIITASLTAGFVAFGLPATSAELHTGAIKVISSDATTRYVPLGINKSIVVELPTDIADVLVGNPKIVNAVVRSKRRVYLIGLGEGQTNVYFYGADDLQIGGLDIAVSKDDQLTPPILRNSSIGGNVITIVSGPDKSFTQTCTRTGCTTPPPTPPPSGVQNTSITTTTKDAKGNTIGTSTESGTTTTQ